MVTSLRLALGALCVASLQAAAQAPGSNEFWPHWRGPSHNGVATANVPLTWSDTQNVAWKIEIPGGAFSTPVIWGNRFFLTNAVPTAKKPDEAATSGRGGRGPGGGAGAGEEHRPRSDRCRSRNRQDRLAAHRGDGHSARGLSPPLWHLRVDAPATDGRRVYAFFGSRGLFVYDLDGKLLGQKDPGIRMTMQLGFGEGSGAVVHDGRVYLRTTTRQPAQSSR